MESFTVSIDEKKQKQNYKFWLMREVGQSIIYRSEVGLLSIEAERIQRAAWSHAKRYGIKINTGKIRQLNAQMQPDGMDRPDGSFEPYWKVLVERVEARDDT